MDDGMGTAIVYLDNAATTFPKPEEVYRAADRFYRAGGANANRGQNPLARSSAELIARTRAKLADWLGVGNAERVVFAPSATIALNQVILGSELRTGDVVYVTPFEHNSVLRPLEHLRRTVGIEVCQLPFDRRTFGFELERARAMLAVMPPTMVIASHASNVCGLLLPVEAIAQVARRVNPDCVVVVDGAQVAGLHSLPLADGLIDYYVFSGHKALYGPYGASGFVLGSDRRPAPVLFGGTGTESESLSMPTGAPAEYEPGSQNAWAVAGLEAALDWLAARGRDNVAGHARECAEELIERLRRNPGVRVHVPDTGQCSAVVSFTLAGVSPQAAETALGVRGFAVRAGLHCAPWAHRWLGTLSTGGTVRASTGYFNTSAEIQALCAAVEDMAVGA